MPDSDRDSPIVGSAAFRAAYEQRRQGEPAARTVDPERIREEVRAELDHFRREVTEQLREMREQLADILPAVTQTVLVEGTGYRAPAIPPVTPDELLVRIRILQARTQAQGAAMTLTFVPELVEIATLVRELDRRLCEGAPSPRPWRTRREPDHR